jgi:hypothetical protein
MKTISLYFVLLFSLNTLASGTSVGNGGISVVCKNGNGVIQSAELFDLFESRALYGVEAKTSSSVSDLQSVFKLADEKIFEFAKLIENTDWVKNDHFKAANLYKKFIKLPKGVGLKLTEDVDNFIVPKNCELAQLINYRHDGKVYIDEEIWKKLDKTNQAATLAHEIIYAYLRTVAYSQQLPTGQTVSREDSSERVRKLVGHLFAEVELTPIQVLNRERFEKLEWSLWCEARDYTSGHDHGLTEFVILKRVNKPTVARFRYINGRHMLAKTEVTFSEYGEGLEELTAESDMEDDAEFYFNSFVVHPKMKSLMVPDGVRIIQKNRNIEISAKVSCALKTY